ncbi:MAG: aminoglycoside phosphotransferase family protein [Gemmatimonadetes bacterium]|nr:aminoglycoside phosphotransferase family protein [Gemmatimonadota bacterium]
MPLPESLVAAAIRHARGDAPALVPVHRSECTAHSNDRVQIRFSDGRTLVVKRARHRWAAPRFSVSRRACEIIARRTGIVAPRPLPLPAPPDGMPAEAYWRIDRPTLADVWPQLRAGERVWALRHWGRLAARLHGIRFPAHGSLLQGGTQPLSGYLREDLGQRLLPAVRAHWPQGVALVERLLERTDGVAARADAGGVLVHNDLHMQNVLCERRKHSARSVGVLDLEAAIAGPPEAELAQMEVLHGPLFGKELPQGWMDEVMRGYGRATDPVLRAFFRAVHLLNMGFHAAFVGWHDHAADVLRLAQAQDEHA